jgi:thymidylate synthase (FAD)
MMISATYLKHMGDDLDVVNAAKVSFAKESKEFNDNSDRLIKYLAKHRHMSPFGHCFARFHVKAPIFVARQLVKHKFLRWNEVSRRYVDDEPEFYTPDVWRGRAEDKKQGSAGEVKLPYLVPHEFYRSALYEYQTLLEAGVAPEQARMVLPQSTMTEWWWSGSLDAFADMCNLRCTGDTQLETRLVANDICDKMRELFPVSWLALRGL